MKILTINGGPAKKILVSVVILVVYCVFLSIFYHFMRGDVFPYDGLKAGLKIYLINLIPTAILTMVDIFIIFTILEKTFVAKYLPFKIASDFIVCILVMYLFIWIFEVANRPFKPEISVDSAGVLLHNVLIIMTLEIVYYVKRSREAVKKAEYAKREAIQYQYDALKSQVNPHFLFNSLNILLSLIATDTKRANNFTMALSHIYRYVLSIQNKNVVLLSSELEFLRSYVSILEIRYNRSFRVEIIRESEKEDIYIVPFTLQLLIENVTKHNVISSKNRMSVEVKVCDSYVSVSNPINAREGDDVIPSGIGLKYIAQQYLMHGKEFGIENDGKTFLAVIPYL